MRVIDTRAKKIGLENTVEDILNQLRSEGAEVVSFEVPGQSVLIFFDNAYAMETCPPSVLWNGLFNTFSDYDDFIDFLDSEFDISPSTLRGKFEAVKVEVKIL